MIEKAEREFYAQHPDYPSKVEGSFSYAKKVYIIGILLALGVASMVYSVTRYQAPNERAVQIALVDSYTAP